MSRIRAWIKENPLVSAFLTIAVAAVVVAAVAVVLVAQQSNRIQAGFTRSQVSGCHTYNEELGKNINALNDQDQALVHDVFTGLPAYKDPTGKAIIDNFVTQRKVKYESVKVPMRDCSSAGIAAWVQAHAEEAVK